MNDKDKEIIKELLLEIDNLKKYSNELANNTRGEKLENYILSLSKNITELNNKMEKIYQDNFNTID